MRRRPIDTFLPMISANSLLDGNSYFAIVLNEVKMGARLSSCEQVHYHSTRVRVIQVAAQITTWHTLNTKRPFV